MAPHYFEPAYQQKYNQNKSLFVYFLFHELTHDQNQAFKNADFIYAKNWSSYDKYGQVITKDKNWMIDNDLMSKTNDAYFMHCLPVRRNIVVADDVLDSVKSIVIKQAQNRIYSSLVVLKRILENEK